MNSKKKTDEKPKQNIAPIKRVVNRLATTQDGKEFINYLMRLCGFGVSSLVIDPETTEINAKSTIYNEARKTVYYNVRDLIDKKLLKEIEYMQHKEDAEHDEI